MGSGVDEYWAVVPAPAEVHIYRRRDAPTMVQRPVRPSPACLPGLEIDLEAIFTS
jgi:Uma2 family endonuclease